jgi:hypothetical protein
VFDAIQARVVARHRQTLLADLNGDDLLLIV